MRVLRGFPNIGKGCTDEQVLSRFASVDVHHADVHEDFDARLVFRQVLTVASGVPLVKRREKYIWARNYEDSVPVEFSRHPVGSLLAVGRQDAGCAVRGGKTLARAGGSSKGSLYF